MPLSSLLTGLFAAIAIAGDQPAWAAAAVATTLAIVWCAVRRAILRCLPDRVHIVPVAAVDLLPATQAAIDGLTRAGFVPLGEAQRPNLVPAPTVLPFVHRDRGMLAAVYQRTATRPRTVVDVVTTFACGATLTTSDAREAATLPPAANRFLQVGRDGEVERLVALHQEGVSTLRAIGRRTTSTAAVTLAEFVHRLLAHVREQRDAFERAPSRTTAIALWRTLFGCRSHERALHEQLDGRPVPPLATTAH